MSKKMGPGKEAMEREAMELFNYKKMTTLNFTIFVVLEGGRKIGTEKTMLKTRRRIALLRTNYVRKKVGLTPFKNVTEYDKVKEGRSYHWRQMTTVRWHEEDKE